MRNTMTINILLIVCFSIVECVCVWGGGGQSLGGVLRDPSHCPQCLLLAHSGKCSDRQSNDFRADFDFAL